MLITKSNETHSQSHTKTKLDAFTQGFALESTVSSVLLLPPWKWGGQLYDDKESVFGQ